MLLKYAIFVIQVGPHKSKKFLILNNNFFYKYLVGIDPSHVTIDEETDGWSAKGQITPPSTPEMKSYRDNHVMIEKEL